MRDACGRFRPDELTPAEAAEVIEAAAELEKLAVGVRLRALPEIDETVIGDDSEAAKARWLAMRTGQSTRDAGRDIATAEALSAAARRPTAALRYGGAVRCAGP